MILSNQKQHYLKIFVYQHSIGKPVKHVIFSIQLHFPIYLYLLLFRLVWIIRSIASTFALNHFGLPVDSMRYPNTNPRKVPHPYPIMTTFHVNRHSSSSSSPSTLTFGVLGFSHFLGNGNPQSPEFPTN